MNAWWLQVKGPGCRAAAGHAFEQLKKFSLEQDDWLSVIFHST